MKNTPSDESLAHTKISILHIPHSSRLIPVDERARLTICDTELDAELLRMTDAFTAELFPPTGNEADRVVFPVSRLVCDVERFPEDADEPMAARGMGAIYTKTSTGNRLRGTLSANERERIIERWYRPHHALLTSTVDRVLSREGRCLIVDCHSFSTTPLPHEPDQDPNRPDICIGSDPFHTPPDLSHAITNAAVGLGLTVLVDRPFAGALVPATHYRSEHRVSSIMIEVNRRLYMDERTGGRLAKFGNVKEAVGKLLSAATAFILRD